MSIKFGWLDGDVTAASGRLNAAIVEYSHNGAGNVSATGVELFVGRWSRGFILMSVGEFEIVEGATFEAETAIPSREPVQLKSKLERPQAGPVGLDRIERDL
ncbi:hypothetical protein Asppvi_010833 [Aspergillus pseudoviridinutans]|uniref:Uncharacterized protein n=1 Tax=Aspergillus pseudoviridinutans TaxID=1517512 RepID=A0A9P3EVC4_9EURO|nr:uncharacterized protein Asppvi_008456 [Aspergillus pseudoviridinutans]XP_043162604.1 uncharacterized protein Asppvi_010833 [Aspergillus pseudoviridinutans]GIJ89514.1 hypothetical protein Asppvi_008456 [Aspergillus pseudoviridinutans]GIJ91858.1 hypothetical protein Asppvi_010833 [Aspergillus pseudoviridinutans]